jgi:hypothetical protein
VSERWDNNFAAVNLAGNGTTRPLRKRFQSLSQGAIPRRHKRFSGWARQEKFAFVFPFAAARRFSWLALPYLLNASSTGGTSPLHHWENIQVTNSVTDLT